MRIYKFLLLSLLFAALGAVHAQTLSLVVTGQVANTAGNPVANHTVYVIGDTTVFPPVFYSGLTNANGAYQITALVPAVPLGSVGAMIVATTDCNGSFLTQTVTYTANAVFGLPANFQLCTSTTPTCSATLTHTAVSANTFTFTATTTASAPVIAWNMGDGNSYYNTLTVTHTYANAGNYVVTLTAIDSLTLCTAAAADTVVATGGSSGATCLPAFFGQFDSTNSAVSFLNMSSTTSGNPLSYLWTFSTGSATSTSSLENPVLFNVNGPVTACLTIIDSIGGCTATYCDSIFPYVPVQCQALFGYSTSGMVVSFMDFSMTSNPAGGTQYFWSFGDGSTDTQENPIHTYATAGSYTVCLTITDSFCTSTYCDSVYVSTQPASHSLMGMVLTGNTPADSATVYLIAMDSVGGSLVLTAIDSVMLTYPDSGFYAFHNLPAGSYAIKAALNQGAVNYSAYLPTYYGGSLFWATATWTPLPSSAAYHNISLIPGVNPGGPGFIGGSVLAGANKQGGTMANVPVLLLDASMNPVAATYSAADGSFSFSNVAYGDYLVYVDMLNRTTVPVPVTLSAAAASTSNIEIEIGRESITYTTGIENAFDAGMSTIYPNPTAANAALDLSLDQAGEITIEITTAVGQTLTSNTQMLSAGKHTLSLYTEALPAGVYLVRLQTSNGDAAIRRMVKQ